MIDEINEIPERRFSLQSKASSKKMPLIRWAIILILICATLLAMLLGSRALDNFASKLWPAPQAGNQVPIPNQGISVLPKSTATSSIPSTPHPSISSTSSGSAQTLPSASSSPSQSPLLSTVSTASTTTPTSSSLEAAALLALQVASEIPAATTVSAAPPATAATAATTETSETLTVSELSVEQQQAMVASKEIIEAKPAVSSEPSIDKPKEKNKVAKHYTAAEKEILKNDPRHYTIQVLGMHNKTKLNSFVSETKLKGKVRTCQGQHQGKAWHIVVYGEYASREEAERVMKDLPESIKKQKPWVRSMSSLQGMIYARE